jgi:hypothetical protein
LKKKEHPGNSAASRLVGGCLLCALVGGVWYLGDADGAGQNDRQGESAKREMSVVEREGLKRKSKVISAEQALELEREYDAIFSGVLARHPGLEPEWKPVPDEKNGFFQWLQFCDRLYKEQGKGDERFGLKLPEELERILRGKEKWDAEKMRAYIESHGEIFQELTHIGLMPEQSCAGIPVERLDLWADPRRMWLRRTCTELLCADARLAAESGDQERALLRVRAAMGLIRQSRSLELTTLNSENSSNYSQRIILDTTMEHVLPVVGKEDVAAWRDVLAPMQPREDHGSVIRGEYWVGIRAWSIPDLIRKGPLLRKYQIENPDRLYDAWAQRALNEINLTSGLSHQEVILGKDADYAPKASMEHLSRGEKEAYRVMLYSWPSWLNQEAKVAARYRQYDAALAILEGSEPPVELVTGKSFVFDPDARTLSFPDDPLLGKFKWEPVKLP